MTDIIQKRFICFMRGNRKIVILSGGISEEKKISEITSKEIALALTSKGYITEKLDPSQFPSYLKLVEKIKEIEPLIVFNGLHGSFGENGQIQSLLLLEKIPFTGSGFKASAICMDKYISGKLATTLGITVPARYFYSKKKDFQEEYVLKNIGFPLVIKPNASGSSVGISIIDDPGKIQKAMEDAFQYSDSILFEKYIRGRELTVAILDDKPLPVVEIKPKNGWYDYRNKYTEGNTYYHVPADLPANETKEIQTIALNLFQLIGCKVYARIDFRYDGEQFYFLEVNTLPGMTPLSLTPMAAKATGLEFPELLIKIIEFSLQKK